MQMELTVKMCQQIISRGSVTFGTAKVKMTFLRLRGAIFQQMNENKEMQISDEICGQLPLTGRISSKTARKVCKRMYEKMAFFTS